MDIYFNTFGTSIRVDNGMISVKKDSKIERIPIGKIKKIFLTKSIYLSSDVLYTCIDNGVDVLIMERNGKPIGRLWNNKFGSISALRRKQLNFSRSEKNTAWIIKQILKKINHQIELLYCLLSLPNANPKIIHKAVKQIDEIVHKFKKTSGALKETGPRIRALEGQAAKIYFRTVNEHLPFIYQFEKRTRHPAKDMVNAMLNYVYGILYGNIESAIIKAGLDPYIGIFHRDEYNRPVFTYDVIEVFRPWADWVVFHLCFNEVLDESMFQNDKGNFWLHGESKRILIQHFNDFFDEVVDFEGKRFSRFNHINRLAVRIASYIEDYDKS